MPSPSGNNGFIGTVIGGSGTSYQMKLNNNEFVTATAIQLDPSEQIPAGSQFIVIQLTTGYYFQPPVFLPPS